MGNNVETQEGISRHEAQDLQQASSASTLGLVETKCIPVRHTKKPNKWLYIVSNVKQAKGSGYPIKPIFFRKGTVDITMAYYEECSYTH